MNRVGKLDIVRQMHKKYGYKLGDASEFIDDFFDTVCSNLADGSEVVLPGYIKFSMKLWKQREFPHPLNGEIIIVEEHNIPKITAGNKVKEAVAKSSVDATKKKAEA